MKKLFFIFTLLFMVFTGVFTQEDNEVNAQLKKLISQSDQIFVGTLKSFKESDHQHMKLFIGVVEVEESISSTFKKGQMIEIQWEQSSLIKVNHQQYLDIQGIWLVKSTVNGLNANHADRLLSLEEYENVYQVLNSQSTRVYTEDSSYYMGESLPVVLCIRNVEAKEVEIPSMNVEDGKLALDENIYFEVFLVTSFNQQKTFLDKEPLPKMQDKVVIKKGFTKKIKSDEEIRIQVDLNQLITFDRNGYYAVKFFIKDYPSQGAIAFEIKNRPNVSKKFDFLEIAHNRFSSKEQKHTVDVLMNMVGETDIDRAHDKLMKKKRLFLNKLGISDLSPLGSFSQLEVLDLSENEIESLEPLKTCKNIMVLSIGKNKIVDLEPLSYLTRLLQLNISDNLLVSLNGIKNSQKLRYLYASGNLIHDLSDLKDLSYINEIDLSNNSIEEVNHLSKILALQKLNLSQNKIKDLEPLVFSFNLEKLDVRKNPVNYIENFLQLQKPHKNEFGQVIQLKILHDVFQGEPIKKENDEVLLPELGGQLSGQQSPKIENEQLPSFRKVVEEKLGISVSEKDDSKGKVIAVLLKSNLIMVKLSEDILLKEKEQLIIFRDQLFIGMAEVVEVNQSEIIAKIITELKNDQKLEFQVGDAVLVAKKENVESALKKEQ